MIDCKGDGVCLALGNCKKRNVAVAGGFEISAVETCRRLPVLGRDFQNDVILVQLCIDDRCLGLSERGV